MFCWYDNYFHVPFICRKVNMYVFFMRTQLDGTKMFDIGLWIHIFYVYAKQKQHC